MIKELDEFQMKVISLVKKVFIALIFVFLGITVCRCIAIKGFDDSSLCGLLFALIFTMNTYKLDRAIYLNKGKLSIYRVTAMAIQLFRSTLPPLVLFYWNRDMVQAMLLALLFVIGVISEIVVVCLEKKALTNTIHTKSCTTINIQEGQINEQDKTK